ncbi:MAG: tetratricopeptide repeat protein [Acidobacteriota bacterium]
MKRVTLFWLIITFFLAIGLCVTRLSAADAAGKEVWIKAKSKHFTLVGNAGEKDIRKVGAELEKFREAVSRLSGIWQRRFTPPVTVFVFKDNETYEPFKPLYQGKPGEVSGYLQSSNDSAYITLTTDVPRQDPEAIIFHEYVHFLTSGGKRSLPSWLSEGLAEYFSTFAVTGDGKQIAIGRAIPAHLQKLREASWLPMTTLLAVDGDSPFYQEADKKTVYYAQSWALTHLLLTGDADRQSQFRQFMAAVASGLSAGEGFKQFFQTDAAKLESSLRDYVRRNVFNSQTISFDRKIEADETMTVVELGDAEMKAHLGDLLWHIERINDGEFALERALAIDAKQPLALGSLGGLRIKQKRFAEARQLLQQAIETGSANYLAYYSHAFAWQQQHVDSTGYVSSFEPEAVVGMRASLNRARELMPDFPDTYKTLAFINLVQRENLDESVAMLKKAIDLEPGREDFHYTLAQVYLKRNEFAIARQTVKAILATGLNAEIRNLAGFLLQTIGLRESEAALAKVETELRLKRERESPTKAEDDPTRPPGRRFEGEQVQGLLTRMDCSEKEVTLTVVSGVRTFKFRAEWGKLTLVRHTMEIPNQITCGAMAPARQVIVTYRPFSGTVTRLQVKFDGEPVGLEFLKPTTN